MTLKEIRELINLMNEHGLVELEIEREGMKVRLRKSGPPGREGGGPIEVQMVPALPGGAALPGAQAAAALSRLTQIKSPMVGTFYRAPAPDAPVFVEAGQEIQVGQVVCIIEAMKLMNEIKAEAAGRLVEILVENGDPVEFGQPLFSIEPGG
ncbi:MAG: acetyl-CoA carboxylase biotin carboxyl carrier protein [Candidatus Omnitrophica bacterium]|nr:acetyl-CoA carboxylase biotin carboxyl carrier protein [Candidatus Omnitrophota bacterium]